jgi:hypothetical protein
VKSLPSKRRILKKREGERGAMIEKKKRWNLSWKAPCFEKRERMKFTSCWERFYQNKERKEITISYSANPMCGLIHTHRA